MDATLYDLTPVLHVAGLGLAIALGPLAWVWVRHRHGDGPSRRRALVVLTLFLTFDLVLFGAFTRLSDSGLGCPDWPGCYGHASPIGAATPIAQAQAAMPTGPVTHGKAWVEMVHRYLATAVGVLITASMLLAWRDGGPARRWGVVTFAWVCAQGAFGALTVTMKLYPAIVTLHLLGGMGLLALLALQTARAGLTPLALSRGLRTAVVAVALLVVAQIALGGWVSTNYAVLACSDFPTCQGQWWPPADFESGFTLRRELGESADGQYLPFSALTAIHLVHRLFAVVVLLALGALALLLNRHDDPPVRRAGRQLGLLALWQLASGASNVVLGWPLVAALAHTGGAAALVVVLTLLIARSLAPVTRPDAAWAGSAALRWSPDRHA